MREQLKIERHLPVYRSLWAWLQRPLVYITLAALPFVMVVAIVIAYGQDLPMTDQWQFVPLLEKFYQGNISLADLWAQHNEHRLLFPQLIMLGLAWVSHWNIHYELAFQILLALGIFGLLIYQIKGSLYQIGRSKVAWLLPVVSLLIFSGNQWENWAFGWDIQIFLNVLAAVGGIVLLGQPNFTWLKFGLAALAGIVSIYSYANGICFFFIGMAMLFFTAHKTRAELIFRLGLWSVISSLTIISYLYDYEKPGYHPSIWVIFERPLDFISYVLTYLGAPLLDVNSVVASLAGVAGLILQGYLIRHLLRQGIRFQVLLPYLGLSLFSVSSALITGIGRAGFGAWQATTPRYITISYLFWLVNIVFLYIAIISDNNVRVVSGRLEDKTERLKREKRRQMVQRYAGPLVLSLIVLIMCFSSVRGARSMYWRYTYLEPIRTTLLTTDPDRLTSSELQMLFQDEALVRQGLVYLREQHLSLFRDSKPAVTTLNSLSPAGPARN